MAAFDAPHDLTPFPVQVDGVTDILLLEMRIVFLELADPLAIDIVETLLLVFDARGDVG